MKRIICTVIFMFILFSCEDKENTEYRISVCAVGDNIIHSAVLNDARNESNYSFEKMYENVKDIITESDISFINQETICGGFEGSGYPLFCTPDEIADNLINTGFNVVNIANNHMLDNDTGLKNGGYKHAIDLWNSKNVTMIGGYKSEKDSERIRVVEKKGINVAFLSYTYGTNVSQSDEFDLYIPLIDEEKIEKDIKKAREVSDFVIVSMHWGEENKKEPTTEQKEMAEKIASFGADAILGHHSHILQPVEIIETGERKTLVAYSLGNFLSTQINAENLVGGILKFDLVKNKSGTHIENVSFVPTVCHYINGESNKLADRKNVRVYPLKDYTEKMCSEHGANYFGELSIGLLYDYGIRTHLGKS